MDPLAVSAYGAEQALPLIGTGTGLFYNNSARDPHGPIMSKNTPLT